MSYYQVLFGLLFAFVCQSGTDWFLNPSAWPFQRVLALISILFLVVNDLIETSVHLERHGADDGKGNGSYDKGARVIDLVNFSLLYVALHATDPKLLGAADSAPYSWSAEGGRPQTVAWAAIALYWLLVMLWSWRTNWYVDKRVPRIQIACSAGIPLFGVTAAVLWMAKSPLAEAAGLLAAISIPLYLVVLQLAFRPLRARTAD